MIFKKTGAKEELTRYHRAELEAAYRFFDNDKVTFDKVLAPHIERTLQRAAQEKIVLLVQDTSEMDLTRPNSVVAGAGTLDNGSRRGFLLHEMQAFTTQSAPTVITGPASAVGPVSATLGGTLNPNGRSTSWYVEYGTSPSFGSKTSTRGAGLYQWSGPRYRCRSCSRRSNATVQMP